MSTSAERMRRWRMREADAHAELRVVPPPESERLLPAVERTIAALELGPEDAAVAALAVVLAATIDSMADQVWALRRLGPLLRKVLAQLHATPMSRARL